VYRILIVCYYVSHFNCILLCTENLDMNSLLSLHVAYKNQKNICDDVKNFQKQDYHSPNFGKIMEWLQEALQMQRCSCFEEVNTKLLLRLLNQHLIMEAMITNDECIITKMEHHDT